jgi:HTH-like domain
MVEHLEIYSMRALCQALTVSRSGFYAWRKAQSRVTVLPGLVKSVYEAQKGRVGAPSVAAEVNAQRHVCSFRTVGRIMKRQGLKARYTRKFRHTMDSANWYLEQVYRPAHNLEFGVASTQAGSAYVPFVGWLPDVLCEQHERKVNNDNCVSFEGMSLQIPADEYRYHYVRTQIRVHRYVDATLAIFHGPRKLANFDAKGQRTIAVKEEPRKAA